MKIIAIAITLFAFQAFGSCPDMRGHWTYSNVGISSDLKVNQPTCLEANLQMVTTILGISRTLTYQGPVDGVKRPMPSSPGERDMASAQFLNGKSAVIYVDQYYYPSDTVVHSKFESTLLSQVQLQVTQSTIDSQGNPLTSQTATFTKQQQRQ
jgi:hypothetical protein